MAEAEAIHLAFTHTFQGTIRSLPAKRVRLSDTVISIPLFRIMEFSSSCAIVEAVNLKTRSYVEDLIDTSRSKTITDTNIDTSLLPGFISKHVGKVRDVYKCEDFIIIVATDRQSAFDRQLTSVPFKGQVLNLTSLWWFDQTKGIVPNHVLACPHPSLTIGKKCTVFPVEFVMRGYITGSTSTRWERSQPSYPYPIIFDSYVLWLWQYVDELQ